jgi:hypothetical protein
LPGKKPSRRCERHSIYRFGALIGLVGINMQETFRIRRRKRSTRWDQHARTFKAIRAAHPSGLTVASICKTQDQRTFSASAELEMCLREQDNDDDSKVQRIFFLVDTPIFLQRSLIVYSSENSSSWPSDVSRRAYVVPPVHLRKATNGECRRQSCLGLLQACGA